MPKCGAASCGAHERCSTASGTPTCTCAPGYAKAQGATTCTWSGVVQDPTFANTPADAWQVENGTLDPAITVAVGGGALLDPGAVVFTPSTATCPDKISRVRQTFEMPAAAEAEGLALTSRTYGTNCGGFLGLNCLGFPKWRNEGRLLTPFDIFIFGASGTTRTYCLGERWYGKTMKLEHDVTGGCAGATFYLDHLEIAPAAECALPGRVFNDNFDGVGGWEVSGADADSIAEVKEALGTNASRGGHLGGKRYCKNPTLTGSISIPEATGKKIALAVTYRGSLGDNTNVYLGPFALGSMKGLSTPERASFCIPDAAKGLAWPLRIALPNLSPPAPFDCTTAPGTRDVVVDDLALVVDETCNESVVVADPDFDSRLPNTPSWLSESDGVASAVLQNGGRTKRAAVLSTPRFCHSASVNSMMSMPEFDATEGYALRFWQKGNVTAGQQLTTTFGDVPVSAAWEERSQCLPRQYAGNVYQLNFSSSFSTLPTNVSCETPTNATIWIDDISIVKDAACIGK